MPVTPTYPGVYIEEVPSGVRTITGVSTSVTAFVGKAKRGPINRAVRVQSYGEYERRFGGLAADSEMSYAARQFFLNGGGDAWVVRLAKDAVAASCSLYKSTTIDPINEVLKITALDEGKTGNNIEVRVDYETSNPASTFNLTFNFTSKDNPAEDTSETFANLSMNSNDARYIQDVVNGVSRLVKVERVADLSGLSTSTGTSTSGQLTDVGTLVDDGHNQLRISVNGSEPVSVQLAVPGDVAGADAAARLFRRRSQIWGLGSWA